MERQYNRRTVERRGFMRLAGLGLTAGASAAEAVVQAAPQGRANLRLQETFIDDGDVDMLKAMRVYKEVGFDGMMMPIACRRSQATRAAFRRSRSATSRP
jgi:hypothetical protein